MLSESSLTNLLDFGVTLAESVTRQFSLSPASGVIIPPPGRILFRNTTEEVDASNDPEAWKRDRAAVVNIMLYGLAIIACALLIAAIVTLLHRMASGSSSSSSTGNEDNEEIGGGGGGGGDVTKASKSISRREPSLRHQRLE